MTHYTQLLRRILRLSGPDARSFLNGLVTVDVMAMQDGAHRYSAMLTPQGKFLHDFFIIREGEALLLDVPEGREADLKSRLSLYRLRAKVEITIDESMQMFVLWPEAKFVRPPPGVFCAPDARGVLPAFRAYGPRGALLDFTRSLGATPAPAQDYDIHRITYGVPEAGGELVAEQSLIMEFGFEQLRGVDFAKGCYVGQEVTARSKFRATLRRGLYCVQAEGALAVPGSAITAGGKNVGVLCSVDGDFGLAHLANDAVLAAHGAGPQLVCAGEPLNAFAPKWLESAGSVPVPVV